MRWIGQFVVTMAIAALMPEGLLKCAVLLGVWTLTFLPLQKKEIIFFCVCSTVLTAGNYGALARQNFVFTHRDVLLMPYHEMFIWGFYALNAVRLIGVAPAQQGSKMQLAAFAILFSTAFALLTSEIYLTLSAAVIFAAALSQFRSQRDMQYAGYFLAMGCVVEFLGIRLGLWSYPRAGYFALPLWGPLLWANTGLLIGRFAPYFLNHDTPH